MSDKSAAKAKVVIERVYRARVAELWDLWTTKKGFESWWGPVGFRVEVQAMEPRADGAFHYDMIADAPEQVAAMKQIGRPVSHETRGKFSEFKKHERLVLTHIIDFLPGVKPYRARSRWSSSRKARARALSSRSTRCTARTFPRCKSWASPASCRSSTIATSRRNSVRS